VHAATTTTDGKLSAEPFGRRLARLCDRRFAWVILALVAGAALIRLAVLREFWLENPFAAFPTLDSELYWRRAGEMAAGDWIEDAPFHIAPLYSYLLGLLRWCGGGLLGLYAAQVALHLATGAIVATAARERFGSAAGCAAALAFFSLAEPALFATRILGTTLQLFVASLLWWDWSKLAASERNDLGPIARTGAWIGLLALAFPAALLLLPVFAVWLAGRKTAGAAGWPFAPKVFRAGLGAMVGSVIVGTATLHNYVVAGEFIPITSHAGITLAAGNSPGSIGIFTPLDDTSGTVKDQARESALAFEHATGHPGSWREIDAYYRDRVLDWWRDHPVDAAALFARKAWWFLTSRHYDNVTAFALEGEYGLQDAGAWVPVETPWILGLAALGAVLALRTGARRFTPEICLAALPLAVCLLFMYSARYRILAVPVLCGLAGLGVVGWRSLRRPRSALAAALGLPVLLMLVNSATGFGNVDFMRDDFADLLADSHIAAGREHRRTGDAAAAAAQLERAAAVKPDRADAYTELASLFIAGDRFEEARGAALLAVRRNRESEAAHRLLYDAQIGAQDYRNAGVTLNLIEQLAPRSGSVQIAMAWFYAANPDPSLRNPSRSLHHAAAAERRLGSDDPNVAMARALAEAANGDFGAAAATAARGAEQARNSGDTAVAAEFEDLAVHAAHHRVIASPPPRLAPVGDRRGRS
jgi:tetratricopeptide (TPR) repeat protein